MENKTYENLEDLLADASFYRWVKGEPGDHELFWKNWLAAHPDKKLLVEKAAVIARGIPFTIREKTLDTAIISGEWEKIRQRSSGNQGPEKIAPLPGHKRTLARRNWSWRIAAALAVLVSAGFLLDYFVLNPLVSHRTPFGHQLTVMLPDSSTVELNANSMLSYRKRNPRKVWLDGEAFFKVRKKPATGAHFWVLTNDLTVEVLGTSFNVIEKKDKTEVILEEGSVRLNLKRDFEPEVLMQPGDMVAFSSLAETNVEKRQVKTQTLTSWKDGVLEFEDVPLTEVMERIETIYGWRPVYFNETLKTRKISIGLPSDDLESALLMLGKAIGIDIEKVQKDGKVLLLH